MWMVMLDGTWQAAEEPVLLEWIRAARVHRTTLVRHSSWAAPIAIQAVPALAQHLPFGGPAQGAPIGSHVTGSGLQHVQRSIPIGWLILGGLICFAGAAAMSQQSAVFSTFATVTPLVLVVVVLVALHPRAPASIHALARELRQRGVVTIVGCLSLWGGGVVGYKVRAHRTAEIEREVQEGQRAQPAPSQLDQPKAPFNKKTPSVVATAPKKGSPIDPSSCPRGQVLIDADTSQMITCTGPASAPASDGSKVATGDEEDVKTRCKIIREVWMEMDGVDPIITCGMAKADHLGVKIQVTHAAWTYFGETQKRREFCRSSVEAFKAHWKQFHGWQGGDPTQHLVAVYATSGFDESLVGSANGAGEFAEFP